MLARSPFAQISSFSMGQSLKRNTAYNIFGSVFPIAVTLVTLPYYLSTIGEERYGVLAIIWTFFGYFGVFNFGLASAVANQVAKDPHAPKRDKEEIFWTAFLLNLGLGLAGAFILYFTGGLFFEYYADESSLILTEAKDALPWLASAFPLLLTTGVLSGVLQGKEEFLLQNIILVIGGIAIQVLPLSAALLIGVEIKTLVAAVIIARLLTTMTLFVASIVKLPAYSLPRLSKARGIQLLSYGGWVSVTSIIGPILTTLDRFAIGHVAGMKAVTYYTVPFNMVSRLTVLPGALSKSLFPKFSMMPPEERVALLSRAVNTLLVIITPVVVITICALEPFLHVWISAEFAAKSTSIGEILVVGIWANCMAFLPYTYIQGKGRPDITAKIHSAELIPYLLLLWLGLETLGVLGAALVWTLRVWVDSVILYWISKVEVKRSTATAIALVLGTTLITFTTQTYGPLGISSRFAIILVTLYWGWRNAPNDVKRLINLDRFRTPSNQNNPA